MTSRIRRYDGAAARRSWIITAVRTAGFMSVLDLSRELGVSDMTVRRDLRKLEAAGEVRAVHGGVALPEGVPQLPGYASRVSWEAEAKQLIGRLASSLVRPGDTIAVDAGTTAYELARALPEDFSGCLVTNSVPLFQLLLGRPTIRVIGLGGDLYPSSQAFVGPTTAEAASRHRVRTFFLGGAAVDRRGVYVVTGLEMPAKQALMDIADQVVLLVDHSKFDAIAPVLLCPFGRLDAVVSDRDPPPEVVEELAAAKVRIFTPTSPPPGVAPLPRAEELRPSATM
jgi:DeoR/GlpR family transcriptional regulator of sugar metabolism